MPKLKRDQGAKDAGPIDLYIAERIHEARLAAGMSQPDLGMAVGITFQQIQKYEKGRNRITAARLYEICKVLKIDIGELFSSLPKGLR